MVNLSHFYSGQAKHYSLLIASSWLIKVLPANICTTSAQRFLRWVSIVQMLYKCFVFNPLTAKLFNLNFHPLEVVSR